MPISRTQKASTPLSKKCESKPSYSYRNRHFSPSSLVKTVVGRGDQINNHKQHTEYQPPPPILNQAFASLLLLLLSLPQSFPSQNNTGTQTQHIYKALNHDIHELSENKVLHPHAPLTHKVSTLS